MIPVKIVRGFDYAIIGVSGATSWHMQQATSSICFPADPATNTGVVFLYCLVASLTVIPWEKARRESQAIKHFNNYWHARVLLLLVGGLWVVSILIANPCEHLEHVFNASCMTCSLLLTSGPVSYRSANIDSFGLEHSMHLPGNRHDYTCLQTQDAHSNNDLSVHQPCFCSSHIVRSHKLFAQTTCARCSHNTSCVLCS